MKDIYMNIMLTIIAVILFSCLFLLIEIKKEMPRYISVQQIKENHAAAKEAPVVVPITLK
ncbi:MAG: hypothetical protein JRI44_07160 [Deltaproteobacteria bacterium]|nr:hypothetical protein [Deltaproteobacteria bacterium]